MASDIFSTLRVYLSKFTEGDRNPSEAVAALNTWLRDSGESIKIKIEEEVERSVKRMGFVKQVDFDRLVAEVETLRSSKSSAKSSPKAKAKSPKKTAAKKVSKPVVKKAAAKPAAAKGTSKKSVPAKGKK